MSAPFGFGTNTLHAGHAPDQATGSRAVPIYQTTSHVFDDADHAARLFALEQFGHIYARLSNPTCAALESRLAVLEGGTGALTFASGMAAISSAVLAITSAGQNIVSSSALYGGTVSLFTYTLPRLGVEVRFVDTGDPAQAAAAIDEKTRLLYTESVGNPKNNVDDFEALARVAHGAGIPFVVDNTVMSPYLFRPIEAGADIVVHSLTKFIGGHGTAIGGAIVDSGNFRWDSGKYPEISEPDPSYHGVCFWERFGDLEGVGNIAYITRARTSMLRDMGGCLSPFNAFLFLQGLESLHVRMPRHCENALELAKWLEAHEAVSWVNYPGLASHPDHERAKRHLPRGAGAIVGFGVKGGLEAGKRFINGVRLISHLANLGDSKSLVLHPASTAHSQLTPEQLEAAGVTPDYIRFSVGIEDVADLKADLDQALKASQA